ncbi:hypothetical protein Tco_1492128 [Tanacetum coccineum]
MDDDHPDHNEQDESEQSKAQVNDISKTQDFTSDVNLISKAKPSPTIISPSTEINHDILPPQDKWSREKHILLVNILGGPQAGVTTRSKVRDSKAASSHECLYVNFIYEIGPKKVTKALEEEGWVIAMQEELNQLENNKVWTLIPAPYGKTIIGIKWIFINKMMNMGWLSGIKQAHVCQRYQANPKESYLVAVKRIFRYLKGTPNLGLWYLKGSGFDLKAYSDSDYIGYNLDKKSTSEGYQILGGNYAYWSARKQKSVAMSSVEAEYVVVAGCCDQVL